MTLRLHSSFPLKNDYLAAFKLNVIIMFGDDHSIMVGEGSGGWGRVYVRKSLFFLLQTNLTVMYFYL